MVSIPFPIIFIIIPVKIKVCCIKVVWGPGVFVVIGFVLIITIPFERILIGKRVFQFQFTIYFKFSVRQRVATNIHKCVRLMTGSTDHLVAVNIIFLNKFIHKQAFQYIITFRGILPFKQPPFLAVLIRNIGKKNGSRYNQTCFISYVSRLCLHRIMIERSPVLIHHAWTETPFTIVTIIDSPKIIVDMKFHIRWFPMSISTPLLGENIPCNPVYDTRRE